MNNSNQQRYTNFGNIPQRQDQAGDTQGLQDLNRGLKKEREATTDLQRDVAHKLDAIDKKSKRFLGSFFMREGDQKMLTRLDKAREEAADIVLSNRTDSLRMISESMRTYTKSLANVLIITLETGNAVALESHYEQSFYQLTQQLEETNKKFIKILEEKQEQLDDASDFLKPMLKDQGLTIMSKWQDNYESILEDFSEIRDRKFK